jgi:hypothetical protein
VHMLHKTFGVFAIARHLPVFNCSKSAGLPCTMVPNHKMTSVTHNAAETNDTNKSSKGLFSKLRASTATTKTGNTNRQTKPTVTQSFVAPKNSNASKKYGILQSFTLQEKDAEAVSGLARKHGYGRTSSMPPQQPVHQHHQQRSSHNHTYSRSSSMPDSGPIAKESPVRPVRRGSNASVSSRGSVSTSSSRERRREIDHSDRTKQIYNVPQDNRSRNDNRFSVMGQQPPPPARRNGSYTGHKQDEYSSSTKSGNPSWFSEEPIERRGSGGILKTSTTEAMYSGTSHTLHTYDYDGLFGKW